jgi:glucose-6-phosphate 1-epimerase
VEGLARAPFFDKVDAVQGVRGDEPLGFGSEVDAVLSPPGPRVTLVDPGLGRRLEVDRDGADQVVVWNPGPTQRLADVPADGWRSFVCVETAAVRERALTLPPGGAAVVIQRVGVR